jgi:hypothetical protein
LRKGGVVAKWSVIIWATVTPDLEESMARDLKEAMIALDALGPGADIHVHSYLHRPGVRDPQVLPAGGVTDDPFVSADLSAVLSRTTCWKDKERQRLLVFWGHGTRAFPPSMLGFTTTAEEKAAAK